MERLDKIIGNQTEYSRKDVKKLVLQKKIKVNGTTTSVFSYKGVSCSLYIYNKNDQCF